MLKRESKKQTSDGKRVSYDLLRGSHKAKTGSSQHRSRLSSVEKMSELAESAVGYRHEIKYIISESKAAAVSRFVELYLSLDHYSKLQPDNAYPIVSLYLDSPDLRLCRESLEGHKNRFKLRIRSYSDNDQSPCFFEVKRRANTVIIKNRARVMRGDIVHLLSGLFLPRQSHKTDEKLLKQFQLYMKSISAGPVVRVRYMRRAYESDSSNRVRVTFDRRLAYNVGNAADVSLNSPGWRNLRVGGVILEIKFTGRYPAWLSEMARCFALRQQSMSKYARSIKSGCLSGFCGPKLPMWMR